MVIKAGFAGTAPRFIFGVAGHGNQEGNACRQIGLAAQPARHLIAIQAWKPDVHQHNMGLKVMHGLERKAAVVSDLNVVAFQPEHDSQALRRRHVVVHN